MTLAEITANRAAQKRRKQIARAYALHANEVRPHVYESPADPTPEEIAEVCAEIQAGWSPEERERRVQGSFRVSSWEAPTYRLGAAVLSPDKDMSVFLGSGNDSPMPDMIGWGGDKRRNRKTRATG